MTSYYFAYGSNLNQQDWNNWCALRGFSPHLLRPITNVYVPDYELHFSHHSNSRGGGALNIVESLGNAVEGMLFEVLDEEGWQALNEKEGAPYVYEKVDMVAYDDLGNEFSVATYVLKEERFHDYVEPAPGYVEIVAAGLDDFDLSKKALRAAAVNQLVLRRWPLKHFAPRSGRRYGNVHRLERESYETGPGIRGHSQSFHGGHDSVAYGLT